MLLNSNINVIVILPVGGRASGKVELLKLVVNGRSRVQIPSNLPMRHGSGPMDAPRGIVVAGLHP